jgi:micrococcal nuclease
MGNCLQIESKDSKESENNIESKEENKEEKEINRYEFCTDENTSYYSYENIKKKVKVLRIIDGDTVDIAVNFNECNKVQCKECNECNKIYKYRVRLYGIDTPEKRPLKSDPNRDKEIAASKRSKEALNEQLKNNDYIVVALFYKPDKYGRLLCTFYDKSGENINRWMIDNGYAYEYFGKTKQKYKEDSE